MLVMHEDLITQAEAARIAGKSRKLIADWLDRGLLTPYFRQLDNRRMVSRAELLWKLKGRPDSGPLELDDEGGDGEPES